MAEVFKKRPLCLNTDKILLVDDCEEKHLEYDKDFKCTMCTKCYTTISHDDGSKEKVVKDKKERVKKAKKAKEEKPAEELISTIDYTGMEVEVNSVYNEDCLITMSRMKDHSVDYVITSPPYNVSAETFAKYEEYTDDLTQDEYLQWQIKVISELLRVTKRHIFYNTQVLANNKKAIATLLHHFRDNFKDLMIWKKSSVTPASSKGVMSAAFELIIVFSNSHPEMRKFSDGKFHGTFTNVLEPHREKNIHADIHKATFPIDLPKTIIKNFFIKNAVVYDPFGGMGTTAKACIELKMRYILSELSSKYYKQILKNLKSKESVQQIDFEEVNEVKSIEEEQMIIKFE